jgi:hypothetical protein
MPEHRFNRLFLFPTVGVGVYIILYVWATFLYPGGSQHDPGSTDFDWMYNYWCDLMSEPAGNSVHNRAVSVAVTAQTILCLSLALFWLSFPVIFPDRRAVLIVSVAGVFSMLVALFLGSSYHDRVIDVSGSAGFIAMLITFWQLNRLKKTRLILFGSLCFLLCLLNYGIYLTRTGITYLPLIQKLTFLLTLVWFCLLDVTGYRIAKSDAAASSDTLK